VTPDGNTVVSISDYLVCIFDWSGNEWKLRDYFTNYTDGNYNYFRNSSQGGGVTISEDGTCFAYSDYSVQGAVGTNGGKVYVYTEWNGTQWDASYSIPGDGWFGYQNMEFSSDNTKLLISEPYSRFDSYAGRVYVYELSGNEWVIRGGDINYMTQTTYTSSGLFGWCSDMTNNGNTVVGSTYNNSNVNSQKNDGFFIVHDWNGSGWDIRGSLVIADNNNSNHKNLGKFCKISNDGNMVALWTSNNEYLRIYYWDSSSSSWINTLFNNNGNSGLTIDTTVFDPANSAVEAYGACFYEDGAKVALKGIWNSAYNIYFYAFNTSNNTWELESTSPNFVLDDGTTALGSDDNTRIINVSNDGNTLCIGNRTAYSNNGAMQLYKYM
jgi:hypothetical protein